MQVEVILQVESSANQRVFLLDDHDKWVEVRRDAGVLRRRAVQDELSAVLDKLVNVGVRQSWMRFVGR